MSAVVYTMYGTWNDVMSVIRKNNNLIYRNQLHYDYYEVTPVTNEHTWLNNKLTYDNCIKTGVKPSGKDIVTYYGSEKLFKSLINTGDMYKLKLFIDNNRQGIQP